MFAFCGCESDVVQPTQIKIINGNVEEGLIVPAGWWYSNGLGNYYLAWTEQEFFSPEKSLGISTQIIDSSNFVLFAQTTYSSIFAFWAQTFITNLPTGRHITLKVKVKGNLIGEGVTISMCGKNIYGSLKQSAFTPKISGNFDWTEYSLQLSNLRNDLRSLTIYLQYEQNTTGEVYFDDISLTTF